MYGLSIGDVVVLVNDELDEITGEPVARAGQRVTVVDIDSLYVFVSLAPALDMTIAVEPGNVRRLDVAEALEAIDALGIKLPADPAELSETADYVAGLSAPREDDHLEAEYEDRCSGLEFDCD